MSKLLLPERRRGHVARPQLVSVLEAGRGARLALVSAPTGFGKMSLLAEWAASRRGCALAGPRGYLAEVPAGQQDVRRYFAIALLAEACASRGELDEAAGMPKFLHLRQGPIQIAMHDAPLLGHAIEVHENTDAIHELFAAAAEGWDGSEPLRPMPQG